MLKGEQGVVFFFKGFESRFQIEESTLVARVIGAENGSLPCPLKLRLQKKKAPTQPPSCLLDSCSKV